MTSTTRWRVVIVSTTICRHLCHWRHNVDDDLTKTLTIWRYLCHCRQNIDDDVVFSTATSLTAQLHQSWQQWPCCAVQTTTSIRPMFSTWTNDNINFLSSINVLHKIWIGNLLNLSCTLWQVQVSAVACEPTLHHMYIVCYTKVDTLYGKLAIWREVRWSHLH